MKGDERDRGRWEETILAPGGNDQQHIVYEIRLIAILCEVSPPFGEEHRGLEQDISFPANKHLLILGKCYAVHINASPL